MRRSLLPPRVRDRHESWFVDLPLPAGRGMLEFCLRGLIRGPRDLHLLCRRELRARLFAVSAGGCEPVAAVGGRGASTAVAGPVPSLTPVQTAALWRQEVSRRGVGARGLADEAPCRLARVVFYDQTDWLRVATKLAETPSPCAEYFISVPPLANAKTVPRSGQAASIRALGANFHALDEISYTGWSGWVAAGNGSWFDAGVTARQRMAQPALTPALATAGR